MAMLHCGFWPSAARPLPKHLAASQSLVGKRLAAYSNILSRVSTAGCGHADSFSRLLTARYGPAGSPLTELALIRRARSKLSPAPEKKYQGMKVMTE
ncbi:hypothetical protein EYF80_046455 [Liparis tanakae]|uniref:Uncharacterized protein n=1 Tax=Liparis tanakae TaxID=230148 RepID=A0A4Z2FQ65_9TELE|nr:hypothetical protein EYF80_046455 [Liparis tanakae]